MRLNIRSMGSQLLNWILPETAPKNIKHFSFPFALASSSQKGKRFYAKKIETIDKMMTAGNSNRVEKESLGDYLKARVDMLDDYLNCLPRSPKEEKLLLEIKEAYQNSKGKDYKDVFPYRVRLEKNTRTYENSGPYFLSEEQIKSYINNGVIGPIPIETISESTLQAVFKRFSGMPDDLSPQQYRNIRVRQEWQSKDILDLACNKEIVSKISSLLGNDVKIRFTAIHEIAPYVGSFSSITDNKIPELCAHSDTNLGARLSKKGLEGPVVGLDSINVWISINGTDSDNGPLYIFPMTHKLPILTPMKYLNYSKNDPAVLERTFKLLSTQGFSNEMIANHALSFNYLINSQHNNRLLNIKRVEIYTKPKDCLIFSTHILHGSDINRTSKTRLAISIRYSRATTEENEDNLKAVNSMFTTSELSRLGLQEGDGRNPIIQVSGTQHHKKSKPINLDQLRKILEEKGKVS